MMKRSPPSGASKRPITVVLAALLAAVSMSACGDGAVMELSVDRALFQAEDETRFSVSVSDGRVRQFTLSDFSDEGEGLPSTGRFDVPESGVLTVEPKLEVDGALASEGSAEIALREDFEWSVTIFRQVDDPTETCIGCMGTRRIPIEPEFSEEEDESLWVVWSGRAAGDDVVF